MLCPRASRGIETLPLLEPLEERRLYAVEKLALVHQELHRPPTALIDVNRDGAVDVVAVALRTGGGGGGAGGIIGFDTYLNDGKGNLTFTSHTDCDDGNDDVLGVEIAAGDVTGDGAPDIALKLFSVTGQPTPVGESTNEQYKLILFGGSGKGDFQQRGSFVLPHVLETSGTINASTVVVPHILEKSGLAAADLDGDGLTDFISWVGGSVVAFQSGPRQTVSLDGSWAHADSGDNRFAAVGDLDGDGRPDLIAVVDGSLQYASYDFSGGKEPVLGRVNKVEMLVIKQKVSVHTGDVDGDGRSDDLILVGNSDVTIGVNGLDAGTGIKFSTTALTLPGPSDEIVVGDLNGDGFDDLVVVKAFHESAKSIIQNIRA